MTKQTKDILIGVLMTLPAAALLLIFMISSVGLKVTNTPISLFVSIGVVAVMMIVGIVKIFNPNEGD